MVVANVTGLITGINHDFTRHAWRGNHQRQVPVKSLMRLTFRTVILMVTLHRERRFRHVNEEMTEETFEQTHTLATPIDCDNAIGPGLALFWLTCQWQYRGVAWI